MATAVATEDVVIIGAGIAGLATALALKRVGVRALVLERADELRATGAALTLFPNAWLALDALGVSHKLISIYAPLERAYFTNVESGTCQETTFIGTHGKEGPRSVHRKALLKALAEELPNDTVRFSSKLTSIESDSSFAIIRLEDGTAIKSKVLIGCDGIHSVVGQWLGLPKPVHSGRSAVRGLAVYSEGHGHQQAVQQFVGLGLRAGFAPLNDTELYWFLATNSPPKTDTTNPKLIQKEVIENYGNTLPPMLHDVVQHADLSTLSWAPLMYRQPWKLIFEPFQKGNITVAGDAMHPMTPDLGQGGCSALEDAVVLGRHIGKSLNENKTLDSGEVSRAIARYVKERRWRVIGLVTGSYLSGVVQQGGSGWLLKKFRDMIFYKYLLRRIAALTYYDCGKLVHNPNKID